LAVLIGVGLVEREIVLFALTGSDLIGTPAMVRSSPRSTKCAGLLSSSNDFPALRTRSASGPK